MDTVDDKTSYENMRDKAHRLGIILTTFEAFESK